MGVGRTALLVALTFAGCTFGGLADYDVGVCDPDVPLEQDGCNELNRGNVTCLRYQCDRATKRCLVGPLDEDRDGDPAIACGGTDCDDRDRSRSGAILETCDGIDNDCDGIADDGLLTPLASALPSFPLADRRPGAAADARLTSTIEGATYATYLGTRPDCVRGFELGVDPGDAGCFLPEDPAATYAELRHPELLPVGVQRDSTSGVVFVARPATGCDREQLAFANHAGDRPHWGDCGAALPSLVSFPLQSEALVAFYDVAVKRRADPILDCERAEPAPLKLRSMNRPTSAAPDLVTSAASVLGAARSTRPPALLALDRGTSVLLASPFGESAGLWALTPAGRVIPLSTSIPSFANARAVAMGAGTDGETTRLAIVAELGCKPRQQIAMVTAEINPVTADLSAPFRATSITSLGVVATAPSVSWVAERREWWVTWIDDRGRAILRRASAAGESLEAPVELGGDPVAAVRVTSRLSPSLATVAPPGPYVMLLRADERAVDAVALTCAR